MRQKTYSLVPGEKPRLKISWQFMWKNIVIEFDDQVIGQMADYKELKKGQQYITNDESILHVKCTQGFFKYIDISHNEKPVFESAIEPTSTIKIASAILYFVSITLIFSAIAGIFAQKISIVDNMDTIMIGIAYGILGYYIKQKSLAAVPLTIIFLFCQIVILSIIDISKGKSAVSIGIVDILIFFYVYKCYSAIKELKKIDSFYNKASTSDK